MVSWNGYYLYFLLFFSPNNHNEIAFTHITKKLLSTRRATKKIINKNLSFKTKHNELHSRFNKKKCQNFVNPIFFLIFYMRFLVFYYVFIILFVYIFLKFYWNTRVPLFYIVWLVVGVRLFAAHAFYYNCSHIV